MRRPPPIVAALAALACPSPALALEDGLARTPPMGWGSWNRFDCRIDERTVRETADAMVATGMRDAGYRYVLLDDCWMSPTRTPAGDLQPDAARFPSGIGSLGRYIHARGLRFGLYQDLGARTCNGGPGLAGREREDLQQFADWGVDYVKVDYCFVDEAARADPARAYARVRDAIRATGRPMVFSICNWGRRRPWRWGPRVGHMWRTTYDIENNWRSVLHVADANNKLARFAGPGRWNDPDGLEVGNGGMTAREDRAHMSLWAIMAAPLMAGSDVRTMSSATRRTLLNPEVLAVDQDPAGRQGRRVVRRNGREVWVRRLRGGDRAVLLLNRRSRSTSITATPRAMGLPARGRRVRDLWARRSLRTPLLLSARVPAHGARLFRVPQ